jgi:hypothetical protein
MNAKGRFDPEELLADARGGCAESFGKVLELNRTDLQGVSRVSDLFSSRVSGLFSSYFGYSGFIPLLL